MKTIKKQTLSNFILSILLFTASQVFAQNETQQTNPREGFMFELGMSKSVISLEDSKGIQTFDKSQEGFAFPELKLGYMLHKNLAFTAVMPGMIYEFQDYDRHFGAFLPSLQYWVKARWWIHGGLGLAIDSPALYDIKGDNKDWNLGCAFIISSGYEIYAEKNYAVNLQSKLLMGRSFLEDDMYRDAVSFGIGLGFVCF